MLGIYFSGVWAAFQENALWLSSSLYQSLLLPLALSVAALGLGRGFRNAGKTALQALAFCAAGMVLFCLVTPLFSGAPRKGIAAHVLLLFLIAVYAVFCSRLMPSVRVVTAAAMISEINWAMSISALVFFPVMSLPAANALQFVLLLGAFFVIYLFRPNPREHTPTAYWLIMLLVAVISVACLFTVRILEGYDHNGGANAATLRIILPAFFVVSLLIYYLYYVLVAEHRRAAELAALQARQVQELALHERTESLYGELSGLRHELKNHFAAMEALLRERQYDKLERYFADVTGQSAEALEDFRCPNALVSSVLNRQIRAARTDGVQVDAVAAIPESLGVADADLCSLLSNLLDNAVEGCRQAGRGSVRATLHTEKGFLFIRVTNPAPPDVLQKNPMLLTTKKDSGAHGFGIPMIRRIAEKYNGCVTFGTEDDCFAADVMLCLEEA